VEESIDRGKREREKKGWEAWIVEKEWGGGNEVQEGYGGHHHHHHHSSRLSIILLKVFTVVFTDTESAQQNYLLYTAEPCRSKIPSSQTFGAKCRGFDLVFGWVTDS